ncbi:hypothetical protein CEE37_12540 [candidate division LCP-89 bacterium B3_LCP]|uniref:Secretion system C-terminal sorting domain-containing protein n=1 Tax=candidate division LCP-89 bacterium B3_LCP TaxID=2012998 RepID=A0A532UUF7_UNCL8|nr:MAG: hypothetical protein CEE37_12540 [candidate division LCP-89 bacterium B3_LCP]
MKLNTLTKAFTSFVTLCLIVMAVTPSHADCPLRIRGYGSMDPAYIQLNLTDEEIVIYQQDFEEGTGGWFSIDLTDPGAMWHTETYNAYSGDSSWWCGNVGLMGYDNNWLQYLVSPEIDLSGTVNPVLSFDLFWAVEEPDTMGDYDGFDGCNVWVFNSDPLVDDWEVLVPDYPEYTCQSLRSFGWRWEMGTGIPGWADLSNGWLPASFDLSSYTLDEIKIRFGFASDDAHCTADDPLQIGFFVDNIEIAEGATVYLHNFAEGNSYPDEFTLETGNISGDYWDLTQDNYHSYSHSFNCENQTFLSDALISPAISIPSGMSTRMTYWVYCDLPDYDGEGDDILDDFYFIEVAPTGTPTWTPIVYDWAHDGSQLQWVERSYGYWGDEGFPTNSIDLSPWAGQDVRLRFRVITDGNDDGGVGEGLFIDDISLLSEELPQNDTGASRLLIPFPTYENQLTLECSVDLINYGTANQVHVPAYYNVNGTVTPLTPWSQINAGDTLTRTFDWTSPDVGIYDFKAYTQLSGDEELSNDTSLAGLVEVTPAGTFELGYDHRQVTYMGPYPFNFGQYTGALVHFTPEEDGLAGNLQAETLKAMFNTAGDVNLHIFADGVGDNPGAEVYSATVNIDAGSIAPQWAEIDISGCNYLQNGHPNFWVWLEVTSLNNTPHITGHIEDCFTPGHFYTYDGSDADASILNFNVRTIMTGTSGVQPIIESTPYQLQLLQNYPNPFNSSTRISFVLPAPSNVHFDLYNLQGQLILRLLDQQYQAGEHSVDWSGDSLPSGSYWLQMTTNDNMITRRITLLK